jgi:hypothetical protein
MNAADFFNADVVFEDKNLNRQKLGTWQLPKHTLQQIYEIVFQKLHQKTTDQLEFFFFKENFR